jgi:hypothetical protein
LQRVVGEDVTEGSLDFHVALGDAPVLVDHHVILADTAGSLPWLQQLPAVEHRAKNAPPRQEFLDHAERPEHSVDDLLLLVLQVTETGRALVVAEEVEAEGEAAFEGEPGHLREAGGVASGDGDGQVRRAPLVNELPDRPLNQVKGRLPVGERPLDIVLFRYAVQ